MSLCPAPPPNQKAPKPKLNLNLNIINIFSKNQTKKPNQTKNKTKKHNKLRGLNRPPDALKQTEKPKPHAGGQVSLPSAERDWSWSDFYMAVSERSEIPLTFSISDGLWGAGVGLQAVAGPWQGRKGSGVGPRARGPSRGPPCPPSLPSP